MIMMIMQVRYGLWGLTIRSLDVKRAFIRPSVQNPLVIQLQRQRIALIPRRRFARARHLLRLNHLLLLHNLGVTNPPFLTQISLSVPHCRLHQLLRLNTTTTTALVRRQQLFLVRVRQRILLRRHCIIRRRRCRMEKAAQRGGSPAAAAAVGVEEQGGVFVGSVVGDEILRVEREQVQLVMVAGHFGNFRRWFWCRLGFDLFGEA